MDVRRRALRAIRVGECRESLSEASRREGTFAGEHDAFAFDRVANGKSLSRHDRERPSVDARNGGKRRKKRATGVAIGSPRRESRHVAHE